MRATPTSYSPGTERRSQLQPSDWFLLMWRRWRYGLALKSTFGTFCSSAAMSNVAISFDCG